MADEVKNSTVGKGWGIPAPFLWGVAISFITLPIFALCLLVAYGTAADRRCASNLRDIGDVLTGWAASHDGQYPDPNRWCDILADSRRLPATVLRCPFIYSGPSAYALNPDASPTSPPDVVLVFESNRGWNLFGGCELLDASCHWPRGCHVLFNDKHIEFVREKNLPRLRWSKDQPPSGTKHEYRNPKPETIPKSESPKAQNEEPSTTLPRRRAPTRSLPHMEHSLIHE